MNSEKDSLREKMLKSLPSLTRRMRSRLFNLVLGFACLTIFAIFFLVAQKQGQTLNPEIVREKLIAEGSLLDLKNWQVSLADCITQSTGIRECRQSEKVNLSFPLSGLHANNQLKAFVDDAKNDTIAIAQFTFSPSELKWLENKDFVSIVIPRNLQVQTRARVPQIDRFSRGAGANSEFTFSSDELRKSGIVELEFDFSGYPFFGPMDLPVVLASPETVPVYQSLPTRQLAANDLVMQLGVAFRLNIAAMALVLDHSLQFGLLALYGVARGVRAIAPFLVEHGVAKSLPVELLFYFSCGLTAASLFWFVLEICAFHLHSLLAKLGATAIFCLLFLAWGFHDGKSWLYLDLWSDIAGCVLAIPIVFYALNKVVASRFKEREHLSKKFTLHERFILKIMRLSIILAALILHLYVNFEDISHQSQGSLKNVLDWKHSILFPALTIAALLEVGTTSKKVKSVAQEMIQKEIIDKELEVGREYQRRLLPKLRSTTPLYSWRALYKPASALAGDWFDVREIEFKDGLKYVAVVVADVTGHGVGAALSTTIVSSYWSMWCHEIQKNSAPVSTQETENLIITAPEKINFGLVAGREAGSCTAIFALCNLQTFEISCCQAGHPHAYLCDETRVEGISAVGSSLGLKGGEEVWKASSRSMSPGQTLFLFSDGLFPDPVTSSAWFNRIRRKMRKEKVDVLSLIWQQARGARALYRSDRAHEDDITLVAIRIGLANNL